MTNNNIVPIGCVTKRNIEETGFIPFSDMINVDNVEECILKAEEYSNLCSENNKDDDKCSYVAYQDGLIIDLLRNADTIYQKGQNATQEADRNNYTMQSLQKFQDIWLNYTPFDREKQLNPNSGIPFLDNYAPWIRKNSTYMTFFQKNRNTPRKPIKMKNLCWIGGKSVLNTNHTELVDFDKTKNPNCKYGLYVIPGAEGGNVSERLKKYYNQMADENDKKAKIAAKKAKISYAMSKFMNDPSTSKMNLHSLFSEAENTRKKVEKETETQDVRKSINNSLSSLREKEKLVKIYNNLADTSRIAINRNIDFVKDKKHISKKMDSDLQSLKWSLKESENKELLQNKITTTLGIIILLFAIICVSITIYYLIKPGLSKNGVKQKTNSNMLNKLFGFNSTKISKSNKKSINNLFS